MKKLFLLTASLFFVLAIKAQNTNYGIRAGSSGNYNTSIGYLAGDTVTGNANTFVGSFAGYVTTSGYSNTMTGAQSGSSNTTGHGNSFFGSSAGINNTTGHSNSFFGNGAGISNTTGVCNSFYGTSTGFLSSTVSYNNFFGFNAGYNNSTGVGNCFFGYYTGLHNTSGSHNVLLGNTAGNANQDGNNNVCIGYGAGGNGTSYSNNVFIGSNAGFNETGSDKLYIANSNTSSPLIYGDFSSSLLTINGNLGIGTTDTKGYKLGVNGNIAATEVVVAPYDEWPDFIFDKKYKLKSLEEVENYVKQNKHLADVPSAKDIEENGIKLGAMNKILLQKVEELYLYMIELKKENTRIQSELTELKNK